MSLPYFPMYPSDFEAKTSHLTLAEDGAYNRLLRIMWMTSGCTIPDDDAWIMRRLRCDKDAFDTVVRVVIVEYFDSDNGRLSNAKLSSIYTTTNEAHERRVNAGSKGGKAKALKGKDKDPSKAKAMPKQPELELELYKNIQKDFDVFWKSYPSCKRKTDKPTAFETFDRIIRGKHKKIKATESGKILSGIQAYLKTDPDIEYVPLPTTWLNGERWNVEMPEVRNGQQAGAFGFIPEVG